jgi:hypothetical protein
MESGGGDAGEGTLKLIDPPPSNDMPPGGRNRDIPHGSVASVAAMRAVYHVQRRPLRMTQA